MSILMQKTPHILSAGIPGIADPVTRDMLAHLEGWQDDPSLRAANVYPAEPPDAAFAACGSAKSLADAGHAATYICGEATSSLDVAHHLAAKGSFQPWDSVLAVSQRSGRGQLRRAWSSPCGNIYAALRLPAKAPFMAASAALAVGCLMAEAFNALGIPVRLKWPNDILLEDCKVGGILLEEKSGVILAGIGINLIWSPPATELRQGWAVPASSLLEKGYDLRPLALFGSLVEMGRFWYRNQVLSAGMESFPCCAERHLAWVGREIVVHGGEEGDRPGRILGLSPRGGLRVWSHGREHIVDSGSIIPVL